MGEQPGAAPGPLGGVARLGSDDGALPDVELDLRGEVCPYTFLRSRLALDGMAPGQLLRVTVDNEASARDVPRSLARVGHMVLPAAPLADGVWTIAVRKGVSPAA